MSALRTVVYAEGPAEHGGFDDASSLHLRPAPTEHLPEDHLGAAHILVRRCIAHVSDRPTASVQFDEPLRMPRAGRRPHGSDLLNERALKQLLTWLKPSRSPDLAVVFVDCDGEPDRKARLDEAISELDSRVQRIVAVSIQEFEAWLVADIGTVNDVLDIDADDIGDPEQLEPGRAKDTFIRWCRDEADRLDEEVARESIAQNLDLERLESRCSAFETFLDDLEGSLERLD